MSIASANTMGVFALLFWSMNVAVTRQLGETHPFAMPGLSLLVSGIVVLAADWIRGVELPWRSGADVRFWIFGGGAFVAYMLLYTCGLTFGTGREVVLPLGLVNYFWPSLTLAMMPFFSRCAVRRRVLLAGMGLCVVGVGMSLLWGISFKELGAVLWGNGASLCMMLGAAVLWAFYSNAARKWGGRANGIGWFQVAAGLCFLGVWGGVGGRLGFGREMALPFVLHAVVVNALAYTLWDIGVRWGDIGLMGVLANFLPIGSVVFGIWYFGDSGTLGLWVGGLLVTAGAVLCRWGISSKEEAGGNGRLDRT